MVGSVPVGGDAPISVQTMTNTLTTDVGGTMAQITAAAEAGADIVRVSCPDEDSTRALKEICAESPVPIVADIHFHYRRAIEAAAAGSEAILIASAASSSGSCGSLQPSTCLITARGASVAPMAFLAGGSMERFLSRRKTSGG